MDVPTTLFIILGTLAAPSDIDQAILAYNDKRYVEAAKRFSEVTEPKHRRMAQFYVARSLERAGYPLLALKLYGHVFEAGPAHPYFERALDGLLGLALETGDDTRVPALLDRRYALIVDGLRP